MKHGIGTGLVVLALGGAGFWIYTKKGHSAVVVQNALVTNRGYSDMMKVSPTYYNASSFQAEPIKGADRYGDDPWFDVPTPWVLGPNAGDGMEVVGGWTDSPDAYSATVSNSWLQGEAQGAHL